MSVEVLFEDGVVTEDAGQVGLSLLRLDLVLTVHGLNKFSQSKNQTINQTNYQPIKLSITQSFNQ